MDIHQNARLTPRGRAGLVRRVLLEGQAPKAVAVTLGVTLKTVNKWCERFQAEAPAVCSIAPRGPIGCASRRLTPPSSGSSRCAANAGPATRSPGRSASRRRPSAASCDGAG